ncbi:DUF3862 domain-containing protein [Oscillatoria sp. FACHB-1407]|uniref:DUF3862 domain-containing protein n=1 Tax=Oscillatoria sp. FACHB-1407 TaxID=2692847 RepID=UPI001689506E|nr:DUF3862 domain-containing protein [Oscillatoria sp. FACHB-1407]MBD2462139.1 DUF3862 domain-containing protein [Oscillatoria sp. FACHB-1407]
MKLKLSALSLFALALSSCSFVSQSVVEPSEKSTNSESTTVSNLIGSASESLAETLAKYERITKSMTVSEVEGILGKADETRRVQIPGETETHIYVWYNSNGSTINLQFKNNSLISKSQLGLISFSAN